MLLLKQGFPEESELVLCTVTRIQFNSVFVELDEYKKQGMIHISEISPGRIRNIRDYVKEGKKVVCVVLKINRERGHIDLSLRRVNKTQHRNKIEQIKKEMKAEKIVEQIAKENKLDLKKLYSEIKENISNEYDYIADYFDDYIVNKTDIKLLKLSDDLASQFDEIIRQRIKPPLVEIQGVFLINIFEDNGIDIIKQLLEKIQNIDLEKINLSYLGAGKYSISILAEDYKIAEEILKKATDIFTNTLEKINSKFEFKRKT
ncbi:MAG: translation initiation factor IF-2 subunit alpha [Nanoarchaeota archaeon]